MLNKIAKHNKLWINTLLKLGADKSLAQDLVQDMYLRINDLVKNKTNIMYGDDVNKYYIHITLRNLYFNHLRRNKRYPEIEYEDSGKQETTYNYDKDDADTCILDKIVAIFKTLSPYEMELFQLHFGLLINENGTKNIEKLSMDKLAKIVGSSKGHIFYKMKQIKRKFRNELGEDALDYFNEEYDRIRHS